MKTFLYKNKILFALLVILSTASIAHASILGDIFQKITGGNVGGGLNTITTLPVRTFLGLTDTPNTYVGQGTKVVSVNVGETALEFTTPSSGTSIIFDIGDDGGNDSTALAEIATSGDTNSIFSEPSADKLLITLSNDWPKSDLADALATNGANCSAGLAPLGVSDTGAVESCFDVWTEAENTSAAYISGNQTITLSGDVSGSGATAITTTIGSDKILESMLKAVDAAGDEECLTYEGTVGDFEWQSCGAGAGATTALDNLAAVAINTDLLLGASDGGALGSVTKQWSDLFLAEGGVINWDNGDLTLTQTGNDLALAGGVLTVPTNGLTINATNVTSTGTQLNYLNAATGTTGTTSTNLVFSTSPVLTTPTLGVATATSINKVAITAPATSATLTIADGKTLTASNSLTLAGTDGKGINVGAATSGKILVGDGTNMVLSTPTFPNASATTGKIIKSDGTNWVASTETYAAPGTNKNVMKSDGTNWTSAAPTFEGLVEAISFQDAGTSIAATTYVLELYAEYAYTINEMRIISGAGTVTANLKIGSTSVTSCSAVSVTTTITSCTASGANTVAVGDKITLVTTSNSGLNDLQATIKTTRN